MFSRFAQGLAEQCPRQCEGEYAYSAHWACRHSLRPAPHRSPVKKSPAEDGPAAATTVASVTSLFGPSPINTHTMASPVPSPSALRVLRNLTSSTSPATYSTPVTHTQVRHATLLRRPKRPYTFTQLVTLSDGSSFIQRTTSPMPVYKATKDTRNTPLWNPSSQKLLNVEEDEAGKLAAFRAKFGRGWDASQVRVLVTKTGSIADKIYRPRAPQSQTTSWI